MKEQYKQRVALIGTAGVPGRYGGFETLVHQMVLHLGQVYQFHVYCSGKLYPRKEGRGPWKGARRIFLPLKANGWQSIIYDILSIIHAAFFCDVLMVFGVSGAIAFPIIRFLTGKKIVVHIDGQEWKRQKWSGWARKFLKWSEKIALRYADAHVADNPAIWRYTLENYRKEGWMIPYGGDHAFPVRAKTEDALQFPFIDQAYMFSVCRIEPENNITMILESFSKLPNRQLVIVGNWDASGYGRELRERFGKYHNIRLLDPIYDPRKLNLLRSNCIAYVHGHSAGGTNPSLVEAMHLGLPILAFDVVFNRETTDEKAIYFENTEVLKRLVRELKLHEYAECGKAMRELAAKRYTWKKIAESYSERLQWMVEGERGQSRPSSQPSLDSLSFGATE